MPPVIFRPDPPPDLDLNQLSDRLAKLRAETAQIVAESRRVAVQTFELVARYRAEVAAELAANDGAADQRARG